MTSAYVMVLPHLWEIRYRRGVSMYVTDVMRGDRLWRGPAWLTIVRDLVCLVLPGIAFIIEALKDKPSVELLVLYMALVSVPGVAGVAFLARHGGTEPPSPPPAAPLSSPPPPSSSSSSGI